jgi:histidyl-tRNA synthetase
LLDIKFKVDDTLVRGLDYYTNFIFEINSTDQRLLGQPTIIGGGRYNNLVKELGGENCSCIGFALGLERLLLVCEYENIKLPVNDTIDVVICNLADKTQPTALLLLSLLRQQGISVVCKFNTFKLPQQFKYAESLKAKYCIILGEKELKDKKIIIKNQKTMKQDIVEIDKIVNYFKRAS